MDPGAPREEEQAAADLLALRGEVRSIIRDVWSQERQLEVSQALQAADPGSLSRGQGGARAIEYLTGDRRLPPVRWYIRAYNEIPVVMRPAMANETVIEDRSLEVGVVECRAGEEVILRWRIE